MVINTILIENAQSEENVSMAEVSAKSLEHHEELEEKIESKRNHLKELNSQLSMVFVVNVLNLQAVNSYSTIGTKEAKSSLNEVRTEEPLVSFSTCVTFDAAGVDENCYLLPQYSSDISEVV
ncbi:hypothetical protein F8388_002959 [Cannabis sativa]|uniref:Uncharacterized protein n=1 Tax=Cannabis sativa TaxID=3483 RepID=A0A7J6H471_CANSA|nr:hypothetical protein F8388_002959 [Cannabis sativa]